MKSVKLIQVFLLLLVIFISGCTGSSDSSTDVTNDVMIFENEKIPTDIIQGGQGIIEFGVVNRGSMSVPAKNVRIELFDPFDLKISKVICSYGNETNNGCKLNEMRHGENVLARYFLESPSLTSSDLHGSIGYSVMFDYSLESSVQVPVTTIEEQITGDPINANVKFNTQAAPIKPHVKISTDKVLQGFPFLISLKFENVGGNGEVVGNKIFNNDIKIKLPDGISVAQDKKDNCDFYNPFSNIDPLEFTRRTDIEYYDHNILIPKNNFTFTGSQTQTVKCWLNVTESLNVPSKTYEIRIDVNNFTYGYEKSHEITLKSIK